MMMMLNSKNKHWNDDVKYRKWKKKIKKNIKQYQIVNDKFYDVFFLQGREV